MSSPPSPPSPHAEPLPRHFLPALGAAVLATGVFAAWMGWHVGGEKSVLYVSDAGTVLAPLLASAACLRAGMRHAGRRRVFWWLLAAACGAWMLGEMVWTGYDLAGTGGPPTPSWADVGYLTFIPLAVAALLRHPGLRSSGLGKARSLLDGLGIAVALLFLSWTSVLGPMWRNSDLTALGDVVTLAYPFGDVVIAFFVLLALRRMGTADRLELWCLLAGLIALSLADSAFAYVVQVKGYSTGELLDTGWFAGFLGIALGALASHAHVHPARGESSVLALPSLVAPLLPMLVALSAAAISINLGYRPDRIAVAMVFALILLALVRQALLVLDLVKSGRGEQQGSIIDRMARAVLGRANVEEDTAEPSQVRPPEQS